MASSRRRYEQRSCKGKVRHVTHGEAVGHRRRIEKVHGDLTIYRCEFCDGFHLGHPSRSRQRQLKYDRLLALIAKAARS